jgi:hypothetical protein
MSSVGALYSIIPHFSIPEFRLLEQNYILLTLVLLCGNHSNERPLSNERVSRKEEPLRYWCNNWITSQLAPELSRFRSQSETMRHLTQPWMRHQCSFIERAASSFSCPCFLDWHRRAASSFDKPRRKSTYLLSIHIDNACRFVNEIRCNSLFVAYMQLKASQPSLAISTRTRIKYLW